LIFDEVITGFGRLGTNFGADFFGVVPDMLNFAKGVTNGVIPMGGVICSDRIYDAMMQAHGSSPDHAIELFHGYTYSGHPVACAAAIATLTLCGPALLGPGCRGGAGASGLAGQARL